MQIPGLGVSPVQITFNRSVKTKIPVHTKLLQPAMSQNIHKKMIEKQIKARNYHVRKREEFREDENILVRAGKV